MTIHACKITIVMIEPISKYVRNGILHRANQASKRKLKIIQTIITSKTNNMKVIIFNPSLNSPCKATVNIVITNTYIFIFI